MLDILYSLPARLARVRAAPLVDERERYLQLCADRGHNLKAVRKLSWLLFLAVTHVPLNTGTIDSRTIKQAAERHRVHIQRTARGRRCASSRRLLISTATRFFRFIGRLAPSASRRIPLESRIYAEMDLDTKERALSACIPSIHRAQGASWRRKPALMDFLRTL